MNASAPLIGRRLLAVFAHPDDEAFSIAGTVARSTRAGARATIVSATRGEAGTARDGGSSDLARRRTAELEASCAAIGAEAPRFLDLPDGLLEAVDQAAAARLLTAVLREEAPEVLLTFGKDGAYGHRDHIAVAGIVNHALSELSPQQHPRVLHVVFPKGVLAPVWRALRRVPGVLHRDIRLEHLGIDPQAAQLAVDIRNCADAKRAAIARHRSQLIDGDPDTFLLPGLISALLDEELFVHHSGPPLPDGATCPFEGLP